VGVARRLASFFDLAFVVLLLAWLARRLMGIGAYSEPVLLLAFASLFLGRVLRTRVGMGVVRAFSSLSWNLAVFCVVSIITLWLLGWAASLQGESLPPFLENQVPSLALAAIALGLGSIALRQIAPRDARPRVERSPRVLMGNVRIPLGRVILTTKTENVLFPVTRFGRNVGSIGFGEIQAQLETPLGPMSMKIRGPYILYGISLKGQPAAEQDVQRITGRATESLRDEAERIAPQLLSRFRTRFETVDLPFVHVHEDGVWKAVDVGPIHVEEGPVGEEIRVGPITVISDRASDVPGRWGISNVSGTVLILTRRHSLQARWDGMSLKMDGNMMRLRIGEEGFEYSPNHVRTRSPLHALVISEAHASLSARGFTIRVLPEGITVRTEGKVKTLNSPELASELREVLAEEAKRHIQNIMEGLPMEVDSTFRRVERVLGEALEGGGGAP
jgi:hypothetical protein